MIDIIKTKEAWEEVLDSCKSFDFYHTYDYHELSKNEGETPLLISFKKNDTVIALPLLLRNIDGTDYKDATSVYGHCGPISNEVSVPENANDFHSELTSYFESEKIVAVFSRLNPYIPFQDEILGGLGSLSTIGNMVNIDLTKDLDAQRSAYRRDTRSRVNKVRRLCSVRKAESKEDIQQFIDIYLETMEKLEANDSYFFENKYFFDFLDCDGFETDILLAVLNETEEVIAGTMFVKTNNIIQYHLSGTKNEHFRVAPSRLLLDEMRIKGTEKGYTYFNLGGGYNGKDDALFSFKSSFSDDTKVFKAWKFIVNQNIYDELSRKVKTSDTEFFPIYRAPK
ncbi:MAG: GNAT family N-acetyltransferase [Maribacter sp.]